MDHSANIDGRSMLNMLDARIGICFGHQIIARAMGKECVPNDGKWEVGVTEVTLTDIGKQLFGAPTIVSAPSALIGLLQYRTVLTHLLEHPANAPRPCT